MTHLAGLLVPLIALGLQHGEHRHLNGGQHLGVDGVGLGGCSRVEKEEGRGEGGRGETDDMSEVPNVLPSMLLLS
jgi:hypothetical protein